MDKIKALFNDKNKRHITMLICFIPLLIIIIVLGVRAYNSAKSAMSLVSEEVTIVSDDHKIESMNYVLRDGETAYQKEIFTELKKDVESGEAEDSEIARLVAMNFVADFYTWSNKAGQYDVGGMYYLDSVIREDIYTKARDTFYKYINEYMEEYGSSNLLEVDSIEATVTKSSETYPITRTYKYDIDEYNQGETYETTEYDAYVVDLTWTYKENDKFSPAKYQTSTSIIVINNTDDGRFEVVRVGEEASDNA